MPVDPFDEYFRKMMKRFLKSFEEMEKEFRFLEKERPNFVIRRPRGIEMGSGFSISIVSNGKGPPKVEMKRFGPSGWEKVPVERAQAPPAKVMVVEKPAEKPPEVKEKVIPGYNVSVDTKEVTITLNAPGVEREENVRLTFGREAVEIYAVSPKEKRGYFCTVALPASLEKSEARIEVQPDKVVVKIPRRFLR